MKFKALRTIREPKEFVHIDTIDGTMLMYTCDLPRTQPLTATLENMREYYINNPSLPGTLTFDDLELVEFEMYEENTVGPDIRNKLIPSLNLMALLRIYFFETDDKEKDIANKERILHFIKKEMVKSEENIKYIANLL
jgi:hypothetical protein